ncbi:MAG: iron ABC transporter permease [Acidimicrobiia bacterium]|nr:iron ABC transporter permease [Acidimicrobiia bacterium]
MVSRADLARRRLAPTLAVVATAALFAIPFGYLGVRAIGNGGAGWEATVDDASIEPLWRSIQLVVLTTVVATTVGVGMAWLTARTNLPGRRLLGVLAVLPLVIPSYVAAYAYVSAFARGGLLDEALGVSWLPAVRGLPGAVFVLTAVSYPYVYLPVAARLRTLPPSLEESARMLGRSSWQTFRSVVLPQCAAPIAAGSLLVALYTLSDFGAVQYVRYDTLTRRIFAARLDPVTSVAVSLLLGVLALAIAGGEHLARRRFRPVSGVGMKASITHRLGSLRWPAFGATAGVIGLALITPVGVVTWWVIRGQRSGVRRSRAVDLPQETWSTAWIGVVSAVATVAVVLPVAWLVMRRQHRVAAAAGTLVMATFGLPGVVIALSLVGITVGTSWYKGFTVLVLAYVLHFGGQALGAAQSAIGSVSVRYDEAARLLGANRWRRLWRIDLRLMAPGLAAAGGLVLLSVMKELPATLMLRPIEFNTLATRINATVEDALFIDAGGLSLVLVALSGVLTWALVLRRH